MLNREMRYGTAEPGRVLLAGLVRYPEGFLPTEGQWGEFEGF